MPDMEEQTKRNGEDWNALRGSDQDTEDFNTHLRVFQITGLLVGLRSEKFNGGGAESKPGAFHQKM